MDALEQREIARYASLENNLVAGTNKVKDVVLPANFCKFFKDAVSETNLARLSCGRINACLRESQI